MLHVILHYPLLWSIAVLALFVFLFFSIIQHFRHESGITRHFFEWNAPDDIHYEQDEEN